MLEKIEKLNKTIEKLMVEKTKADAQKEVWEKNLKDCIKEYSSKYGVELAGESFSLKEIKANISKESKVVLEATTKEYEQAQKLVSLIQNGEIKEARKLLGVEDNDEDSEEVVEEEQAEANEVEEVKGNGWNIDEDNKEDEETEEDVWSALKGIGDEDDDEIVEQVYEEVDEDVVDKKVSEDVDKVLDDNVKSIMFEEDDDDDIIVGGNNSKGFIEEADEDEEETSKGSNGGISFIDEDEDDDDDFGGFGDILKGSKFMG